METSEFNKLLQLIKFDKRALEPLYKEYYGKIVLHFSYKYGRSLSEDIAQEFFIMLSSTSWYGTKVEFPNAWVYKCCYNIAQRKATENAQYSNIEENTAIFWHDFDIDSVDFGNLHNAIKSLDEYTQKIIYMHHWEGYSFLEISNIIPVSYAAVRQKYHRGLIKIKKLVENVTKQC